MPLSEKSKGLQYYDFQGYWYFDFRLKRNPPLSTFELNWSCNSYFVTRLSTFSSSIPLSPSTIWVSQPASKPGSSYITWAYVHQGQAPGSPNVCASCWTCVPCVCRFRGSVDISETMIPEAGGQFPGLISFMCPPLESMSIGSLHIS